MKKNSPIKLLGLLVGFFMTGGSLFGQTCPDQMISYWKLQEASGSTFEDSYGSNDAFAPVSGPTVDYDGASGSAQMFSAASSSYLNIPDDAQYDWGGGNSFSIELWVKFSGTSSENQVFIGRDESSNPMQWWIGSTVTGKIIWFIQASDGTNGSIQTDGSFNNGSWHHIVAVRNGPTSRNYLYVDGVLQNTGGTGITLGGNLASSSPITLGTLAYSGNPDYFLTGSIDEVAIYSRVLDPILDVQDHYTNVTQYDIGYCDGDDPIIFSEPNTRAQVGQAYTYNVDASGNPRPTYALLEGPQGMTINTSTGEINWTPASITQNGHVIVRASNDKGSVEQDFNIFIADLPMCRNNLIAYWDFDEGLSAPYLDEINNYILSGSGPTPVNGIAGKGLLFDGTNDSLNMYDNFHPDRIFFDFDNVPNFSIEFWIKSSASPAKTIVVVGRDDKTWSSQFWVGVNPDGTVGFFLQDWPLDPITNAYLEGGSVLNGQWHHIVASYSNTSNRMELFVDKVRVDNTTASFWNFGGNAPLNVGMLNTSFDKYWFDGVIDELAFYNTQLTSNQVTANYDAGWAGQGACVYNHAPGIISSPVTSVEQDAAYEYQIVTSDIDPGDQISITAVTKPDWATFIFNPGDTTALLTGNPGNDDVGTTNVKIRVSDGVVAVDQDFSLEVVNKNDPPVITSSPLTEIMQNDFYSYTVVAEDPDGDELTYSAPVKPMSLTFDPETQTLSGNPTNDDVPSVNVTIRVSDGTDHYDQEFVINVTNVNDPPVVTSTPVTEIFQNEDYNYTVIAMDPDGDELQWSAPVLPGWLSFDVITHKLSGSTADFVGFADVTINISDGQETTPHTFQIEVKNVNDAPVITSEPVTFARVGEPYLYQMTATDEDPGDVISFVAESIPDWLTFVPASNSAILSGTPTEDDKGAHTVIIKVTDGQDDVLHPFTIQVNGPIGIEDVSGLVERVYPIPAVEEVYFDLFERGDVTLVIYDINGVTHKQILEKDTDQVSVDVSDLDESLYFYRLTVNNKTMVGKIVKE